MIIQRRFRPLGTMLQRFGRGRINNYTTVTNLASRAEIAPFWEGAAEEPLVWADPEVAEPDVEAAADVQPPRAARRAPQPQRQVQRQPAAPPSPAPSGLVSQQTPSDLAFILERHRRQMETQEYVPPPSPFNRANDAPVGMRQSPRPAAESTVQRQETSAPAPTPPAAQPSAPANVPPVRPAAPTGRRRGRVIEEITPPQPDSDDMELSASVPDAAPDLEPDFEPEPDKPDLYEALVSEGIVQRRPDTPLNDAETFSPRTPANRPDAPRDVQRQADQPTYIDTSPARPTPRRSRSEVINRQINAGREAPIADDESQSAEPPPAQPSQPSQPETPVQRSLAESFSDSDADSAIPEAGSSEADMLDMLGLPPDTPVMGLRAPGQPSAQPAASPPAPPIQRQPAQPDPVNNVPPRDDATPEITGSDHPTPPSGTPSAVMRQEIFSGSDRPDAVDSFEDFVAPGPSDVPASFSTAETVLHDDHEDQGPAPDAAPLQRSPAASSPARPDQAPTRPITRRQPDRIVRRAPQETAGQNAVDAAAPDFVDDFQDDDDDTPDDIPPSGLPADGMNAASAEGIQRRAAPTPPAHATPAWDTAMDDDAPEADVDTSSAAITTVHQAVTPPATPNTLAQRRSTPPESSPPPVPDGGALPSPNQPEVPPRAGYKIEGISQVSQSEAAPGQVYRMKTGGKSADADMSKIPSSGLGDALPSKTGNAEPPPPPESPNGSKLELPPELSSAMEAWNTPESDLNPNATTSTSSGSNTTAPASSESQSPTAPAQPENGDVAAEEAAPGEDGGGVDIEQMARDVYNRLRDRLRIEQERRSRH